MNTRLDSQIFSKHSLKVMSSLLLAGVLVASVPALGVAQSDWTHSADGQPLLISQGLPPLQGRVVTAPAGSYMQATLSNPISSEFARVGDRFTASLGTDLAAGGSIILPAGSQLEGQVVSVRPAGRAERNGELDVRFTSALLPNGQRVPISAKIQTEDGTGIIRGGSVKGSLGQAAIKTGVGAGLGAALGTAMGPLSGGRVGRGAIYGTILGSGLGAASSLAGRGKDAVLNSGQPVNIQLDQPLTISPTAFSQPYDNYGGGYNQQNYSQPQYGQPQYGQPQYGQPAYPQNYNQYNQTY